MRSPAKKFSGWWLDKVRANAARQIEPDETVRAATYGQQTRSLPASLVCFWKPRLLVATDRSVYLFKGGILNSAKVADLVVKRSLESAQLVRDGRSLTFADATIWPPPGAGSETSQVIVALDVPKRTASSAKPASAPPPNA